MKTSSSNDSSVNVQVSSPTTEETMIPMLHGQMIGIANAFSSLKTIIIVFLFMMMVNWIGIGFAMYAIHQKSVYLEKHSANTQKLVWELKRSLELEFSQERSAKAK